MTTDEVATLMKGLLAEIRQHTTAEKDDATVNAVTRPAPLIDEFQAHTNRRTRLKPVVAAPLLRVHRREERPSGYIERAIPWG